MVPHLLFPCPQVPATLASWLLFTPGPSQKHPPLKHRPLQEVLPGLSIQKIWAGELLYLIIHFFFIILCIGLPTSLLSKEQESVNYGLQVSHLFL